jgi:hypothetical protein
MPFVKGNTIGATTRFKTGQSGNPAGRPPDRLRKRIEAELEKIASSEPGEARTKLELLAENIVSDALRGDSQSRKLLIERLYPIDAQPARDRGSRGRSDQHQMGSGDTAGFGRVARDHRRAVRRPTP